MNDWHGVGHRGGMWFWWILGIAIIGVLAWAVVKPLSRADGDKGSTPEQLLKRRYAQGHIDKEDYEKRLQDLRE
ncbi:MAG: SHOCT domain-containing protein [Woeseiaceae bacterium]|nr:SHOCT domain-containing protein [Woeseiaceae bacterium]